MSIHVEVQKAVESYWSLQIMLEKFRSSFKSWTSSTCYDKLEL